MVETLPTKQDIDRKLISDIAMDVGKEAVSHLRLMYPDAFGALGASGATSLRNCVHNEIMAALETIDAEEIESRLKYRRGARRKAHAVFKKLREETDTNEDAAHACCETGPETGPPRS